jgi:hypothetical protein
MEQIVCVVLGGAMFLAFAVDYELRDPPQTSGSSVETRVRAWTAGALIMAMAVLICLQLAASEA